MVNSFIENVTILIVADKKNRDYVPALVNSIRAFQEEMPSAVTVLFDNDAGENLRKWGEEQLDLVFVYSDEGEVPYGKAVMDMINGLQITGDVLLVPGTHVLLSGTLSGMERVLCSDTDAGIVGANFRGATEYGLGKDFFINDYEELSRYSQSCSFDPYETEETDLKGNMLIAGDIIETVKELNGLDGCDEQKFKKIMCIAAREYGYKVIADISDFWWDVSFAERTPESYRDKKIFLSIGIPTYNRGRLALELGKMLLEDRKKYGLEECVEIFFSDNGSELETEEYEELKELAENNKNYEYVRASENKGYEMNVVKVISRTRGRFCLILSDEDRLFFSGLLFYCCYLKEHPEIGVMKGHTDQNYTVLCPAYRKKGYGAIDQFYLKGNYVSGAIYNRSILKEKAILGMHNRYSGVNRAYYWYPHLFWDTYCLLNGAFASSDIPLVHEGETGFNEAATAPDMLAYGFSNERIDQGTGYVRQIADLGIDDDLAVDMFMRAYNKTLFLLRLNRNQHEFRNENWDEIIDRAAEEFKESIHFLSLKEADKIYPALENYIDRRRNDLKESEE